MNKGNVFLGVCRSIATLFEFPVFLVRVFTVAIFLANPIFAVLFYLGLALLFSVAKKVSRTLFPKGASVVEEVFGSEGVFKRNRPTGLETDIGRKDVTNQEGSSVNDV